MLYPNLLGARSGGGPTRTQLLSVSEVSPNDVCDIVPGTGRRSIRRQDDGIPVWGLLPSVLGNVVEPDLNTTFGSDRFMAGSIKSGPVSLVSLNRSPVRADKH